MEVKRLSPRKGVKVGHKLPQKKKSKVNQLDTVFAYLAVERNWNQAIRDENPDFFSQVPRRAYAEW
jgi:hypothetical protein